MAKDPAILWYWNDWNGGTSTFTRHLKGCYIDLLSSQFNSGRLSLAEIKTVLGADFGQAWPALQKKFRKDESGLFYNERMEQEQEKRKRFTESRRRNLDSKQKNPLVDNHMVKTMGVHMDNEIENDNSNVIKEGGSEETINPDSILEQMAQVFMQQNPEYPFDRLIDLAVLKLIAEKIVKWQKSGGAIILDANRKIIRQRWGELVPHIRVDGHLSKYSLTQINKHFQSVVQSFTNGNQSGKAKQNGSYRPTITEGVTGSGTF